jgi:4'-phosphopantetheinyl transferase
LNRFYDLWALKEAYIKARGMGLAIPLASFSYHFHGNTNLALNEQGNSGRDWNLWLIEPLASYSAAIALCKQSQARDPVVVTGWHYAPGLPAKQVPLNIIRSSAGVG